jgi:MFS family permease
MRSGRPAPRTAVQTPVGIRIGAGATAMVVAGLIAALVPASQPAARAAVVGIGVGVFAAITVDQLATAAVALIGFLIVNGFLEDRYGTLAWHGYADLWRAIGFAVAGVLGYTAGQAYRALQALRSSPPAQVGRGSALRYRGDQHEHRRGGGQRTVTDHDGHREP